MFYFFAQLTPFRTFNSKAPEHYVCIGTIGPAGSIFYPGLTNATSDGASFPSLYIAVYGWLR